MAESLHLSSDSLRLKKPEPLVVRFAAEPATYNQRESAGTGNTLPVLLQRLYGSLDQAPKKLSILSTKGRTIDPDLYQSGHYNSAIDEIEQTIAPLAWAVGDHPLSDVRMMPRTPGDHYLRVAFKPENQAAMDEMFSLIDSIPDSADSTRQAIQHYFFVALPIDAMAQSVLRHVKKPVDYQGPRDPVDKLEKHGRKGRLRLSSSLSVAPGFEYKRHNKALTTNK